LNPKTDKDFKSNSHWTKSLPWEVFVLVLIWLGASQFIPATVDSVRDIYQANAIATGAAFPLTGPQLAQTVHLGPLWFYILAVPAALFSSWGSIVFLAFTISALKFWLAYILGRELHSKHLGLLFALFLALPGWSSMQLFSWTHTVALETTLLLYLLSLRRSYKSPGAWNWLLTGFCYSLALHAHPTALPFVFLMLIAWRSLAHHWLWVACIVLGVAIPFLPYGFEQLVNGFPDLIQLQRYHADEFSPGGPVAILKLVYSIVVIGPNLFYKTALSPGIATIAIALHWSLISVSCLLGIWRWRTAEAELKQLLGWGIVTLVVVVMTVALIRARTPWHLVYAPSFVVAYCYAVIAMIGFGPNFDFRVRALLSTIIITLFLVTMVGTSYKVYDNGIRMQELVLYDVKNLESPWGDSGLEIPAFDSKAHGDFLCQQAPVVLHGPYAAMVDAHVGMEAEMSCGDRDTIMIGGVSNVPGYTHLAGITAEMNENLGSVPYAQVGNVFFYRPLAVSNAGQAIPLVEGNANPPRQAFSGGSPDVQKLELQVELPSALLISKPVGYFLTLDIDRVTCNGTDAHLVIRSNYAWLYRCAGRDTQVPMRWQVWYRSSADNLIDAVLLPVNSERN